MDKNQGSQRRVLNCFCAHYGVQCHDGVRRICDSHNALFFIGKQVYFSCHTIMTLPSDFRIIISAVPPRYPSGSDPSTFQYFLYSVTQNGFSFSIFSFPYKGYHAAFAINTAERESQQRCLCHKHHARFRVLSCLSLQHKKYRCCRLQTT